MAVSRCIERENALAILLKQHRQTSDIQVLMLTCTKLLTCLMAEH